MAASCTPCDRSWTSSLLGQRGATIRRRKSSIASCVASNRKEWIGTPSALVKSPSAVVECTIAVPPGLVLIREGSRTPQLTLGMLRLHQRGVLPARTHPPRRWTSTTSGVDRPSLPQCALITLDPDRRGRPVGRLWIPCWHG